MEIPSQFILMAIAPIFLLCIAAEFLYLRRMQPTLHSANYSWADTISNGVLALLHEASDAICNVLFIFGVYALLQEVRLFEIENTWLSLLILFVLQDFFYYWFHRSSHRIRFMWASHVVHHSSERLNLSTAFRQSLTYPISGMWLFWTPIVWLGFEPELVVTSVMLSLGYQFFVHTQVVKTLGPLEWILNTPSHHRVHHARNPEYIDRNYAGVLIIWDKIFGTFVKERVDLPCVYGITQPIHSHNPLRLTFHEWIALFKDALVSGKPMGQRLKHFWAPPEWQPDNAASNAANQAARSSSQTQGEC